MTGCCTALLSPAWNSTVADSIPRELPQASAAVAIAYNVARAVLTPSLAGVIFTHAGGAWIFLIAVLGSLTMIHAIRRWPPRRTPSRGCRRSSACGAACWAGCAMPATRGSSLAQLVRTMAYGGAGSALWALRLT